jgi:hypothetical protein
LRRLRTMRRIAGRTMRPGRGPILRDAAKAPLLPSERKCAHPGMRVRALAYPLNLSNSAVFNKHKFAISPHHLREVCQQTSRPLEIRGRREDRVRAAPAVSCAICASKKRTRAYRSSGSIPAFPAQWLYGLYRALPGERLCCHRRRRDTALHPFGSMRNRQLDASTAASGPHDFAVRIGHVRLFAPAASTASHRTFVTIASRPSSAVRRA